MNEEYKNRIDESCCTSNSSCCESSENMLRSNTKIEEINTNLDPNKINVDIYVPLDACACEWSQFMNLIFTAITPYIKHIKHETKNLNSDEARKLNLRSKCVIVDGEKKYTTSYALKKDLPKLLAQKGLI
ncbi:MAG: hypothetical protein ACFFAO_18700 [Candidatus Hermodarchaeota archaeon]